ncbi:peptidase S10 [Sphingomonas sp. BT-65]|uniref:S10 family peptidase n=1 Tax=Sphingomonas sp. BT-65 TaxID=2989821 RepID=UPI002235B28E|nr:peptidase S10 [Sphingomonas sp. BT-65]MCW4460900.1 peptidase S10 [Sphingomonas sp. BT-65]
MTRTLAFGSHCSATLAAVLLLGLAAPGLALAQAAPPAKPTPPTTPAYVTRESDTRLSLADLPAPRQFVTRHEQVIGGRRIAYKATAEELYITNGEGEPVASFFNFSYVDEGTAATQRPVIFVFNGGPGSASLWLHLGVLGPTRMVFDRDVDPRNIPPFRTAPNPDSLLDVADLVFIDPVGTGFSRALGRAKQADFNGVDADADSVARFIEAWLTKYGRWSSPKFVMGESYGASRAAILPRALLGGVNYAGSLRGITLDGIILVGGDINGGANVPATDPETRVRGVGALIPGMAVTARYHGLVAPLGATVADHYAAVERFVRDTFVPAALRFEAGTLPPAEAQALADKLAAYTGVPAKTWLERKFAISQPDYGALALAAGGRRIGLYDSRYTLPAAGDGGDFVADDPAMTQYTPPMVGAFQDVLRNDLKVRMDVPYKTINWEGVFNHWDRRRAGVTPTQTAADDLRIAMRRQPRLRVLFMSGLYDMLATPMGFESAIVRSYLPRDRVTARRYESGHMSYLGGTAKAFAGDVRAFVRTTLSASADQPAPQAK